MFHLQSSSSNLSRDLSVSSETSHHANSNSKKEYTQEKFDEFHLKSPSGQINLTAQQHFNNQTVHAFSSENLTLEINNSSKSANRRERSLQSPKIERQFSELDDFLRQTYEKHGITNLISSFIEMEDQLVSTFEYLKNLQERKGNQNSCSSKNKVRCFEEINEVDEYSFEAQENIINEFLYNLQSFFIPTEGLGIKENQVIETERKNQDFSFSQTKSKNSQKKIHTKRSHIHNSRSKHIIKVDRLKPKREMFSDQKMIRSIHLMNKQVTPLKFEEMSLNKISEKSMKWTNSELMGEESVESENTSADHKSQEELLKTIFELRQEILALKQARYDQNGTYSHNSSYYLQGNLGDHYFKTRGSEYSERQESHAEMFKGKSSFKLLNDFDAKIKDEDSALQTFTHPITINEESENEASKVIDSSGSFKMSGLEKIQVQEDKENNPNLLNSQSCLYSKTTKLKNFSKESQSLPISNKKSHSIESNVVKLMISPQKNELSPFSNQIQLKEERYITEDAFKILLSKFIDEFVKSFKQMFKVEMEIELILLSLIRKKKGLEIQIYNSFSDLIDWYSELKINSGTKQESLEKFVGDCVIRKVEILQELKMITDNLR